MERGERRLRTAAWYGDRELDLTFPPGWDVSTLWPSMPPPLDDDALARSFEEPLGQPPLRELARGRRRPIVIVDDLNRPTPAARVLPHVLRQLEHAGIAAADVGIVMGPGTHGAPPAEAMVKKVGPDVAATCRIHVHDARRDAVSIGKTSFGTPVLLNRDVAAADLVIGVGGVYPNHTAGFGGGSKTILGVLGFRTIFALHHGHASSGWGADGTRGGFRRDVDEIARMAGLASIVAVHVGPGREVVRVVSGDPQRCLQDGMRFSRENCTAPIPEDADVVVCNAYPGDLSLTFTRMKGATPLQFAPEAASRVAIASCPEGLGFHGLFPFLNAPRWHRQRHIALRLATLPRREVAHKIGARLSRRLAGPRGERQQAEKTQAPRHPVWLFRPIDGGPPLPAEIPGMRVSSSWEQLLDAVRREQGGRERLRVVLYPCASLQGLVGPGGRAVEAVGGE